MRKQTATRSNELTLTIDARRDRGPAAPLALDAERLLDLAARIMSKTLAERLLNESEEAGELELTVPQLHALRYLYLHERVLVGDLAEGLTISYPSATNMVKRLAEKELVCRNVNPGDRREVEVMLTASGRAVTTRLEDTRRQRLGAVLDRMAPADRDAMLHGLTRFIACAISDENEIANEICLRCGWRASENCPIAQTIPLFPCK